MSEAERQPETLLMFRNQYEDLIEKVQWLIRCARTCSPPATGLYDDAQDVEDAIAAFSKTLQPDPFGRVVEIMSHAQKQIDREWATSSKGVIRVEAYFSIAKLLDNLGYVLDDKGWRKA